MKRTFTNLISALALLVFMAPNMVVWGQTRDTKTDIMFAKGFGGYTTSSYSAAGTDYSAVANSTNTTGVTYAMQVFNGSSGAVRGNQSSASSNYSCRNTTTYSNYYISSVSLTVTGNGNYSLDGSANNRSVVYFGTSVYSNPSTSAPTGTATKSDQNASGQTTLTWTNTNEDVSYFILYNLKTSGTCLSKDAQSALTVVWTQKSGGGQQTVVAPTFDPESGTTFEESLSVKITPAANTTMYYTTDGSAPSSSTGTGYTTEQTVNLTATTTIKAIAYDGSNNASSVAEATYTKLVFDNIEDITEYQEEYTVKGTVVATNSRGFVIGDGTGYVYTYLNAVPTQAIGDKVNISGTTGTYGHILQFTSSATIATSTTSNYDGTPAITIVDATAIANYNSDYQLSDYVQYEGTLTKTTGNNPYYNIAVGTATARISYPTTDQTTALDALVNKTVRVKGYFAGFSSSTFTTMMESIEEVVSTDPSIEASAGSSLAYNAGSGSIAYEINNYVAGTMTATTTADWISNFAVNQDDEMGEVTFDVTTNTAYENRSAVVTLTYTYGRSTVTANVTVTQLSAPYIAVTPNAATVAAAGDLPEFGITYASLAIADEGDFDVDFFVCEGTTTTEQPDWIDDYEITEGTNGYVLTVAVDENTGEQRVAYLRVYALEGNNKVYSNLITITQSAPAQPTIDLRGTTAAISFSPGAFTASGTGYQSYSDVTYTGSNNVEYSGWVLTDVLHSSSNMQMKASTGKVEMPTIKTDYGFTISVTATTNSVTVSDGTNSGTNSLTTTSTDAIITISAGSSYAIISTITITPTAAPATYDLTVSQLDAHINAIFVYDASDETEPLIANGEAGTAEVGNGTVIHVSLVIENGYALQSLSVKDENDDDVETNYDDEGEYYYFTMPASNVTISATAVEVTDYQLFSGALVEGDYIIYYKSGNTGYVMKSAVVNNRLDYSTATPTSSDIISTSDATIVWHIAPSATEDYWTIYNVSENKYAASTGADNKAQLLASGTDDKSLWSVSGTYEFVNKYNAANNKNANLRNNSTSGFACYNPNNVGGALSLYKKVEPTYTININGYGDSETNGWNLIASPVTGSIKPATVQNLLGQKISEEGDPVLYDFDLYRFNQVGANGEWENYHQHNVENEPFMLENGKGYLYARKTGATLTFYGQPCDGNTKEVPLAEGWNLIGNPFNTNATLSRDFYAMNEAGSEISVQGGTTTIIGAMKGVFVQANQANETATFTKVTEGASNNNSSSININLTNTSSRSASVIDRAIVRFNGNALPKFQLFENSTKLYIPQNGEDFAIVSAEAQGEMPVNFVAAKDGQFTISVNPENVEMSYLHLIDNITGADVDLLANPSYTFNAKGDDYASRFRLVFSASNTVSNAENGNFAFISNGQIILNGVSNDATIQVIDMLGRVVSSQTVNGNCTHMAPTASGVYVLRLIDGTNVMTQKIVVK